jgi:hypothetical protein
VSWLVLNWPDSILTVALFFRRLYSQMTMMQHSVDEMQGMMRQMLSPTQREKARINSVSFSPDSTARSSAASAPLGVNQLDTAMASMDRS